MSSIDKKGSWWKWVVGFIVIIILSAVFLSGIWLPFQGTPLSTRCITQQNYTCSEVVYSHSTGNLTLIIGQSTRYNWTSVSIYFVPFGTANVGGIPSTILDGIASGNVIMQGLASGSTSSITLRISSPSVTQKGTVANGSIWAKYTTSNGGPYYAQMALLKTSAT